MGVWSLIRAQKKRSHVMWLRLIVEKCLVLA